MRHNRILLALAMSLAATSMQAQLNPLPHEVNTLVFRYCNAIIVPDTVNGYEDAVMNNGSGTRVSDGKMVFYKWERPVRIHLRPGTISSFDVGNRSEVAFEGTFHFPDKFELKVSDVSKVTLADIDDTVSAKRMNLTLKDVAHVTAKSRLQPHTYEFNLEDFSHLKVFLVECMGTREDRDPSNVSNNTNAIVDIPYFIVSNEHMMTFTKDGGTGVDSNRFAGKPVVFNREEIERFFAEDDDFVDREKMKNFASVTKEKSVSRNNNGKDDEEDVDDDNIDFDDYDFSNPEEVTDFLQKVKTKINKGRSWGPGIDFAWGFHNWGKDRFNGLAGTDDDAAVRTSFNHILLTFNYPVLTSKRVALYGGLGLEWDKYKFHRGDIHFDLTAEPYHLYNGTVANSESRLLTRYVILPIEVKFDLGRHWKLGIAAIPGIHWSGSHTGLRRDITSGDDETNIKDYSVNPYINPYKLDARIAVQYHSIGVYFQASMFSAFKGSCDELFPVKFGIIL